MTQSWDRTCDPRSEVILITDCATWPVWYLQHNIYLVYAGSKSSAKSEYINIPQVIRETLKKKDPAQGF